MTRQRLVNYFETARVVGLSGKGILVGLDARCVPICLSALEARIARSFYDTDADFERGFNLIVDTEVSLLNDAVDRLILETRATRGGDVITEEVRDTEADPFDLPLETISGMKNELNIVNQNLDAVKAKLDELIAAAQASGDNTEVLDALAQIALLLG